MDLLTFAMRMGLALLLGALMGLERQWHQRMAGTRTNALVATAASSATMIGIVIAAPAGPSRIVGQIVTGIGFLGAGVIFKEGGTVHGLNTAATVWCSPPGVLGVPPLWARFAESASFHTRLS